jgi:hypothetical protein
MARAPCRSVRVSDRMAVKHGGHTQCQEKHLGLGFSRVHNKFSSAIGFQRGVWQTRCALYGRVNARVSHLNYNAVSLTVPLGVRRNHGPQGAGSV